MHREWRRHNPEIRHDDAPQATHNPRNNNRNRRHNPTRQRINGIIPEAVNFGASLSTQTPIKMSLLAKNGKDAPAEIKDMFLNCSGMPMKASPINNGTCAACSEKTAWYCTGCKRWFCMERRALKENTKTFKLYSHNVRGKKKTFLKMCFHEAHEAQWCSIQTARKAENGYSTP